MIHQLPNLIASSFWLHDIFHPLVGNGYQFWSGIGSDLGEMSIIVAVLSVARHHNCHQRGCWRLGRFAHGHFKLCRIHHPLVRSDGEIGRDEIDDMTRFLHRREKGDAINRNLPKTRLRREQDEQRR